MESAGLWMLLAVAVVLLASGLPAYAVLMGVAALFAAAGLLAGALDYSLLTALPSRIIGLLETDLLQALPLCGVFGFCQAIAALAGGAVTLMLPAFEAEAAAQLIERYRVTGFNGTDEMFARLLAVRSAAEPFPSLRACFYAAFNPMLEGISAEAADHGVNLSGLYGMSEVQALFARQRPEAALAQRRLPGGFPVAADYGASGER